MATITFRLKSKSNKNCTIYCRFSNGKFLRQEVKTKYSIPFHLWNIKKGLPKKNKDNNNEILLHLKRLELFLYSEYFKESVTKIKAANRWLHSKIYLFEENFEENSLLVIQHIDYIIETAPSRANQKGGVGLSIGRIKSYITFKAMLKSYEAYLNKELFFNDISLALFKDFSQWLFDKKYAINYIGKNINLLKTICLDAKRQGVSIFSEINEIKVMKEKKKPEEILYLSFEELLKITQLKLSSSRLINARKWLLLGCYTGQRGGDLMRFKEQKIVTINTIKIIEWHQEKTNKLVAVPVLSAVENLVNDESLKPISLQKFGKCCKEIGFLAGIDEPVCGRKRGSNTILRSKGIFPKYELMASHICRRTFATNFYGSIPTATLLQITGHSSERMFLKYIGKTSYDYAIKMADGYHNWLESLKE